MSALKRPDPARHLRQAITAQNAGDHQRALDLSAEVLAHYPGNPQALLMGAQSCLMLAQYGQALIWLDQLLAQQPRHAMAQNNRGVALEALGRDDQARQAFTRACELEPYYEDARLNAARCLQRLGRHEEALAGFKWILQTIPSHEAARVGLGQVLRARGHHDEAIQVLQETVAAQPHNGAAWMALGDCRLDTRQWSEAVVAYGQASSLLPHEAICYANCGKALRELRQLEDALLVTDAAIALDPECLPARRNKVVYLLDLSRWSLAVEACFEVIRRDPKDALTHNNLGFALNALKQYDAALDAFQTATRHDEKLAIAWVNQACTLELMNRHEDALAACEKALQIQPDYPNLLGRLSHARLYVCDWRDAQALNLQIRESLTAGQAVCDPFRIISFSDRAQDQQQVARRWERELPAPNQAQDWPSIPARRHSRRIRVGYFSADFHHHATTLLMARMLERHDRSRFECVAVSFGPPREDEMRARLRKAFEGFHDVMGLDDDRAARLARTLDLDIAVDLKGYTMDHRIGLFQRRVAPVQISYLGFPGTLGASFMDYILADQVVIPDHLKAFYDEKVIRIPGTYQANDETRSVSGTAPHRSELGLPSDGFVFCCFNNNYKITPEVFDVWMRLLQHTPGSVLWLLADNDMARRHLMNHAQARGVNPERLIFAPRVGWEEHLARQTAADLFLDTLPCNAHTTASDALRMGLPVITCSGTSFASRVAASLLHAQGLQELVTSNLQDYEQLALSLAQDKGQYRRIRQQAQQAIATGALLDSASHVRHVEAAYQAVMERAWQGLAPDHLDVRAP